MDFVKNDNYDKAVSIFSDIEKKYPLSNEAVQSQIMSGFIDYMNCSLGQNLSTEKHTIIRTALIFRVSNLFAQTPPWFLSGAASGAGIVV